MLPTTTLGVMTAVLISLAAALASTGRSPTAKKTEPKIGQRAVFHDRLRGEADDGVVAVPPGEFAERNARNSSCATGSSTAISNSCADNAVS